MSTSCVSFRSEFDNDYAVDSRGSFEKISKQNRRPQYRRSSTPPGSVNGIHKRRSSRWNWGHGRSAQAQNLRAFARCALVAFTALWATAASAGVISIGSLTIDLVPIGNPGNVANPMAPSNVTTRGGGSVGYEFQIGKTEVTNAQYAFFLNSVAKTDLYGLYNTSMNISRTGSPGSWVYSTSSTNADRPVVFVSAYDTFRFANWLQNGMPTSGLQDASSTEDGAYTLTGTTGQPTRNPGATFWIPSVNEWYKAAYYNQTLNSGNGGYTLYAVNSGTSLAGTAPGGSTTANWNNAYAPSTRTIDVGSYTSAMSAYGLYDMVGNAAERLDTPSGTGYLHASSWFGTTDFRRLVSNNAIAFPIASITGENRSTGFRIAAVPEPSTMVLAGLGIASGLIVGFRREKSAKRRCRG